MLRCSHCGKEFSEWAARCPYCREPADPVATPTSGAPTAELGGPTGAPGDRPPGTGSDAAPRDPGLPWRFAMPGPSSAMPPDAPPTTAFAMFPAVYDIPFHYPNPVTGRTDVAPVLDIIQGAGTGASGKGGF